jgi:hypothetical protein
MPPMAPFAAAYPLLDLLPPTPNRVRQHAARGKPLMRWLETLWHRSAVLRLAVRGVVLALTAWPLMVLALKLEPQMDLLPPPLAIVTVTGLVVIEAALFVVITMLFRKVK